jgi:hypothetical protein
MESSHGAYVDQRQQGRDYKGEHNGIERDIPAWLDLQGNVVSGRPADIELRDLQLR